jgi:cysteinyl-tRNA synthetase
MPQQLFNTLTSRKEILTPLAPGKLGIYVCGPTVYDLSHIGHARAYVAFDTVVRFLRRNHHVTFVRNYTDVDDKIIKRAAELGESPEILSERFIHEFKEDMRALHVLPADVEPKVTEHIPEIVALIQKLIVQEVAYVSGGDVYYAVERFARYGSLAKRSFADMEAGARIEISEQKRNPLDFALWKAAKPGEIFWDSPWGQGRPGWHIECSAMSSKYLGETFDLHGGGKDLIFPHHENEIAQSEAASHKTFARYWMHNGFVNIDNEKMSKSLGNFFTIRDVLKQFDPQTLRFYLLTTHYRSPINFSDAALQEAENRLQYMYETLQRLEEAIKAFGHQGSTAGVLRQSLEIVERFEAAMQDDFNTPKVLADLAELFKLINETLAVPKDPDTDARTLRAVAQGIAEIATVLGILNEPATLVLQRLLARQAVQKGVDTAEVERLIASRQRARADRDFKEADRVRDLLAQMHIVLKDGPDGTTWDVKR